MDQLTGMRVFAAIVDKNGFAPAAEALGMSKTMVSKHLAAIEDRLGVRLLHRTTRKVGLTEIGTEYLRRCQDILQLVEEANGHLLESGQHPRGLLRVNAPVSFSELHLASCIGDYRRLHPDVQLDLVVNDRVIDLIEEGFDIAVRIGRLKDSSLVARRLAPAHIVLAASPAYLEARGVPERPDDLVGHDCLLYAYAAERDEWRFESEGRSCTVRVHGPISSNNGGILMQAAIDGQGIVALPTFIAGKALRDGRLVEILARYKPQDRAIYAVFPANRHLSPKVRSFVDFLVTRFGGRPYWEP
ncbi:LysR family transcriptional regulator [Geminicoccus roseus]|uniref:LysR family transcriptional regulator n=1 Tax=Geminicoccus roseus TaxID=404900 RepID=UPI00041FDE03|nr:LysR family transcriptional regulator [Geminicoccus roseus]